MDEEKNVNTQALTPIHQEDELLTKLAHEAAEHQRVWGIVAELTTQMVLKDREVELLDSLLSMRVDIRQNADEQNARIHHLEERIVKQKHAFNKLEECRAFERETERLLAEALDACAKKGSVIARMALEVHEKRKGPRSQEADAS